MRKVILEVAISLDGFIEGPNGEYDWCFTDQDYGNSEFFKKVDTLFIGRKTYELMVSIGNDAFAGFPPFKEYIFSTTLEKVKDGAVLIKRNIKDEVDRIKKEDGKDIWLFGGASLTTSLINLGLVDELSLAVHPILLGKGKPLFKDIRDRQKVILINSKAYSSGLTTLNYRLTY